MKFKQQLAALLFVAFALALFSVGARAQALPPWVLQEADRNPRVVQPLEVTVTNNTLNCVGRRCTLTTGGGSAGGSDTQLQRNNAGALGGISGATSDGTNVTFGSNNLRATSPRVVTGINDTNGNELILFTATGSAINEFTIANAASGGTPTLSITGGDANPNMGLAAKGTGAIVLSSRLATASNDISIDTGQLRFGSLADNNWRMGRASIISTISVVTNGSIQIGAPTGGANGIAIGAQGGSSVAEFDVNSQISFFRGMMRSNGLTQANLGTPANGSFVYCSDCTIANPCASGGSGALAKRLNSIWVCN